MGTGLPPHLREYRAVFCEGLSRAREITDPLSTEQFNWRPSRDEWSVGECLDHLNIVARRYVPALESALTKAKRSDVHTVRYGWVSRRFVSALSPGSRPARTFAAMKPSGVEGRQSRLDKEETVRVFAEMTASFIEILERSERVDPGKLRMRSPFLWLLKLPVGVYLEALGQHTLRHLDQAERVTRTEGFPKPGLS